MIMPIDTAHSIKLPLSGPLPYLHPAPFPRDCITTHKEIGTYMTIDNLKQYLVQMQLRKIIVQQDFSKYQHSD